jgi:hypothetical protein
MGEQRLVGGHHVLATGEGAQDERAGGLQAADQLDDEVNGRIVQHAPGVAHHRQRAQVQALARAREIGVGDRGQSQAGAGALLQHRAAPLEDLHHAGPDGAEAEQADPDVAHRGHAAALSGPGA